MTAGCSALTPFKARTARCAVLESSGVSQGFVGEDGGDPSNVESASARRAVTSGRCARNAGSPRSKPLTNVLCALLASSSSSSNGKAPSHHPTSCCRSVLSGAYNASATAATAFAAFSTALDFVSSSSSSSADAPPASTTAFRTAQAWFTSRAFNAEALKAVDVNQACAVLKAVVDAGGASADDDDEEETKSRAVENAANAVAAVADALYAPDSTERQQLVGWWLGALPFEEDDEEARRAHRTLVTGLERGDPALRAHLPLVTARLADALSTLEGSPPSSPTKPCETPLDSNTAQRAVRALKGVNAEQPAVIQSAYAGLMKPAQEALQKALASA